MKITFTKIVVITNDFREKMLKVASHMKENFRIFCLRFYFFKTFVTHFLKKSVTNELFKLS